MIYDLLALTPLSLHDVRQWEGWDLYYNATSHLDCGCCEGHRIEGAPLLRAMDAGKGYHGYHG